MRYIGRANLEKRLAPLEGVAGRSVYRDGSARLELAEETLTVTPPFGLDHEAEYEQVVVDPLLAALRADHRVAVLLVRLGGYALGSPRGRAARRLEGRHPFRQGAPQEGRVLGEQVPSAPRGAGARPDRGRGAEAARVLGPWRDKVDHVALGGDRTAVGRTLAERPDLDWLAPLALDRFFDVPDPRLRVLEELPYQLYAAKVVEETLGA